MSCKLSTPSSYNPSVRQVPRKALAPVIPAPRNASILDWLETTGRMLPRDPVEVPLKDADNEEITDLMGVDDAYDDDDDTDDEE